MRHYGKGLGTKFPHMGNMGHFFGGKRGGGWSKHARKATRKVSVLLYFFPTNHDFQRSAPGLLAIIE